MAMENELENLCCLPKYDDLMMREGIPKPALFDRAFHCNEQTKSICCSDTYYINIGLFKLHWAVEFWRTTSFVFDFQLPVIFNLRGGPLL